MASKNPKKNGSTDDEVTKQRLLTNQYEKEQRLRLQTWVRQSKKKQKKNRDEQQEEEDDSKGLDETAALSLSSGRQYDAARRRLQTKSIKVPEALLMYRNRHQAADFRRRLPDDHSSEGTLLRLPPVSLSGSGSEEVVGFDRLEREEDSTGLRLPIMFPADDAVRRALYEEGTTTKEDGKGGGGRADYLFRRSLRRPESRYRFPVVSSWAYGWNVRDVVPVEEQWKKAENRLRNLVQDTFYARNGINLASQ